MSFPYSEYSGAAGSTDRYVVVAGGYTPSRYLNNVSIWDSVTNVWYSDTLSQARVAAGSESLNGTVLIAGGYGSGTIGSSAIRSSNVDIFSTILEPASITLLGLGTAALLTRRHRRH